MIRVVIDTNILVSALPAAVLMLALSGQVQLCLSEAVFAEYDDVIRRPRFKRTGNQLHFPQRWKKTQLISARELIELLMEQAP